MWLVTASHVIPTEHDLRELGVPVRSRRQFLTLGSCTLYRPDNLNLDVAIILIQDEAFEQSVLENWRVLDESAIARFDARYPRYIVAGYPRETLARNRLNWRDSFTQIYTSPYPGGGADADHNVLRLAYAKAAPCSLGAIADTPHLGGLSGSSVWNVVPQTTGPWAPEKNLKVVALQVSFMHSEYISAEWWTLVLEVFRRWANE